MPVRILLLGGTTEARVLADALADEHQVTSSLAGRLRSPELPDGEVRVGGFGGVEGLTAYLTEHRIDALVDATHPFAATMTQHAFDAAKAAGIPSLVLHRPSWPRDEGYVVVPDVDGAVEALPRAARVFLTIGRQHVGAFAHCDSFFLVRAIERPRRLPGRHVLLLERGPFTAADERELMERHQIDVLVTKDSGSLATVAKLEAARALGVQVILIERPALPVGADVVPTVERALAWVAGLPAQSG